MDNRTLLWLLIRLAVLGFIFLVFFLKVVVLLWLRPRKIQDHFSKQGIRGPPYKFFIGNVKELMCLTLRASSQPITPFSHNILPRVLSFYHHWKKIYGATFLVWFGSTVRLTVADPDLIREIFASKSDFYEKNEAHPLIKQLEGDGLLSLKGEKWARHRKIINPAFHMENLKLMVPVVAGRVSEMLDRWSDISQQEGREIEVSDWFQNLTEDVITRTAFGSSYEDGKAIFGLQNQQMLLAADAFRKVFIPGYRFLPTRNNLKSWKLDKEIKQSLIKLTDLRRDNLSQEIADENRPKDLLGLMIQASAKEGRASSLHHHPSQSLPTSITYSDIVEECKSFFFAGKQTTSNLMTWTTVLLAMHPHWQVLARDEVLRVCGSGEVPTKDDIVKLKTVNPSLSHLLLIIQLGILLQPCLVEMVLDM
uniref:Cytochrome P450 n=1 Tax=Kalanchoe fedtschenkoi TaxID=63787 RepID=A0A7N0TFA9_KALFE